MPDIFDEVEADLRAERARRIMASTGVWVVAAVLLMVGGAVGLDLWRTHYLESFFVNRTATAVADRFGDAMRIAGGPEAGRAAAIPLFDDVIRQGGAGYRSLARLREASLKAESGDLVGASTLWDQTVADGEADPMLRDYATLQWALHHVDTAEPEAVAARLRPLTAPTSAWHALATEAQAVLDMRQDHKEAAIAALKPLAQDAAAPEAVRGRATALLSRLGS